MIALLLAAAATAETPDALVRRYHALIGAHRYARAHALWGYGERRSGKSLAGFSRGYANTAATRVTIGKAPSVEGAAGSLYATVPVRVDARLADGTRQRFIGAYVLRRVNRVPGSTPAQRRWHIDSARLHARPPA